jgi:hypothetical protein
VLAYRLIAETRLAWHDRAGKVLQTIGPAGHYGNPALSPDEQQAAVGRLDFETGASDVWLIDLARGDLSSRFTSAAAPEDMPLWSPDGRRIVYKAGRNFYQKAADGTGDSALLLSEAGAFGNRWTGLPMAALFSIKPGANKEGSTCGCCHWPAIVGLRPSCARNPRNCRRTSRLTAAGLLMCRTNPA